MLFSSAYPVPHDPVGKFFAISVAAHVLAMGAIILSQGLHFTKRPVTAVKYFQMVNARMPRIIRPEQAKPKLIEKHSPAHPKTKAAAKRELKPAPALAPKIEKAAETPTPESEPEMASAPTEVTVNNADFRYDWYLAHITSKVENFWQPPKGIPGDDNLTVVVFFKILRSGDIGDLRIEKSSGNETIDRLGLRSVERAAPFARLPPRFSDEELNIIFKLNYIR